MSYIDGFVLAVPKGKTTDFYGAVKAQSDEAVCFAFVEWPDRDTRNSAMKKLEEIMHTDPRMAPDKNPMPFDGSRLIYGGFETVVKLESGHGK